MDLEYWFRNIFYWIFSKQFFENQELLRDTVQFSIEYPYPQSDAAFVKQIQAIEAFDCQKSLSSIEQETLIVCGKEDLLFPPEESIKVLQAIPRTSVSLIEGAPHCIHMQNPRALTDCVLHFMNKEGNQ